MLLLWLEDRLLVAAADAAAFGTLFPLPNTDKLLKLLLLDVEE